MLKEQNDIDRLNELKDSLNDWAVKSNNTIIYDEYEKDTESLYRFGWFIINDYKYSISGWKIAGGIITFENEENGEKFKYNMGEHEVIAKPFIKDNLVKKLIKKIRFTLSQWLRELSDKLQP